MKDTSENILARKAKLHARGDAMRAEKAAIQREYRQMQDECSHESTTRYPEGTIVCCDCGKWLCGMNGRKTR